MSRRIYLIMVSYALCGIMFWYSVDKVFQRSIGIDPLGTSLLALLYIVVALLLNVPSGILADRLGRKYAIICATVCLLLSSIICTFSTNITQYAIGFAFWGVFYATRNGAYEALIYDTLNEEGRKEEYGRIMGRANALFWVAIFISGVIGAWLGSQFSLKVAFMATIIPNILGVIVACLLVEPKRAKAVGEAILSPVAMAHQGFKFITSSPNSMMLSGIFMLLGLYGWIANEFGQLFFIELGFGILAVGLINSISGAFQATGNFIGHKFQSVSYKKLIPLFIALFALTFALPISMRFIAIGLFMMTVLVRNIFYVTNNVNLQKVIPDNARATTLSSLGMLNDGLLILAYPAFGLVSQHVNVRTGFLLMAVMGAVIVVIALVLSRVIKQKQQKQFGLSLPAAAEIDTIPR